MHTYSYLMTFKQSINLRTAQLEDLNVTEQGKL